ncbi:sigma 54-interacting transcriptional regulator [candidate division KSB1 bacterium]|nr:sigma 54-interacting transcriptional regulator [candidate division KSB1 bacterium]
MNQRENSGDRQSYFEALYRISQQVNSITEIEPLLNKIMDIAMETVAAERGFIVLIQGENLTVQIARNISPSIAQDTSLPSTTVLRRVIAEKKPLLSQDAQEDPRFAGAESVVLHGIRSVAGVPLVIKDRPIGAIYVDSQHDRRLFTAESLEFLTAFANQAAIAIENARLYEGLRLENIVLKKEIARTTTFGEIIGRSPAMEAVFNLIAKVARTEATTLIEGESGTGKELVARAIHLHGPRKDKPFVALYCGALPDTLIESELFGHRKGAFTGAISDKMGLFEIADGGTFFLDEIADLNPQIQTKLLRVLQDGEIRRVGDTRVRKVDVRLISATNKELAAQVKRGKFREDLYYRLNVISIRIPPLRERAGDIHLLADRFLKKYAAKMGKHITGFTGEAKKRLRGYAWPGNVRELENAVERAVILTEGSLIRAEDLFVPNPLGDEDLGLTLREKEKKWVYQTLERMGGNRRKTAQALGVSLRWLQYRLKGWND